MLLLLFSYPTFLLSRYSDPLVLSLWNKLSLLQVWSFTLLLHVSINSSTKKYLSLFSSPVAKTLKVK